MGNSRTRTESLGHRPSRRCALLTQLLADTKISEDHVENVLHVHPPEKLAQCPGRQPKLLRHDFFSAVSRGALRALQREHGFLEMRALTLACDQRGLGSEEASGKTRERVNQFIDTSTRRAGYKVNNFLLIESRFNSSSVLRRHQIHFVNHQPSDGLGWSLDQGAL